MFTLEHAVDGFRKAFYHKKSLREYHGEFFRMIKAKISGSGFAIILKHRSKMLSDGFVKNLKSALA